MRMNNKFPNEKLVGLEAPKPEVWGVFCRAFQFCLGSLAGTRLEKAICVGISGQPMFTESHLKLWASSTTLPRDLFPLELILSSWHPNLLTSIFEV